MKDIIPMQQEHMRLNISEEAKRLIEVTKQSFFEGIKLAVPGNHLFDISEAIQKYVESNGYSVVRDLGGTWNWNTSS